MIEFWLAAALMCGLAVALLLQGLARRTGENADRASYDAQVYRDQLTEVARDKARGVLSEDQAAALEAEIGRRLLDAARGGAGETAAPAKSAASKIVAVSLMVAVPAVTLALYIPLGRPDLPALPLATRDLPSPEETQKVMNAVAGLARELQENPDDLQGWVLLGEAYRKLGRPRDAIEPFRRAVALSGGTPELNARLGESIVEANQGTVLREAELAFRAVLERAPDDRQSMYYLGWARAQAGDAKGAIDWWAAMMKDAPADAPWLAGLQATIAEQARGLGLSYEKAVAQASAPPMPAPVAAGDRPRAPNAAQMEAAQDMSAQDRGAMIANMVEGLRTRLADNPNDWQGWLMLARSSRVLEKGDEAAKALAQAAIVAPNTDAVGAAIVEEAVQIDDAALRAAFAPVREKLAAKRPQTAIEEYLLALEASVDKAASMFQRVAEELPKDSPARTALLERAKATK
jgi:cytochrome c-type biogenesis protein CcmH